MNIRKLLRTLRGGLTAITNLFRGGLVVFLSCHMALAGNLPTGMTVVHGDLKVQQSRQNMQIHQRGQYGIADWDSFNVGRGYGVHFNNGSGATLNRVTGLGASNINGTLSATGSLYLLNPNGIIIGADGQVLTGGDFVASTLEMTNADFLNGGDFTLFGNSPFEVTNLGQISSTGGDVLLAGYTVKNSGLIEAANGRVALVAGTRIDVLTDASWLYGAYGVSLGERGNDVTNEGRIEAMVAELRTHNGNIYALAGNNEGLIHATGVQNEGGRVILVATDGLVESSGTIVAESGSNGGEIEIDAALVHNYGGVQDVSGEQGGTIRITTGTIISDTTMLAAGTNGDGGVITIEAEDEVLITSGGLIDASGSVDGGAIAIDAGTGRMILSGTVAANGQQQGGQVSFWGENVSLLGANVSADGGALGGELYVGGGYQGASIWDAGEALLAVSNSQNTYIGTGTVLSADAGAVGDGGTVVAWSDGTTQFAGSIFARGGLNGGNGGLVETSGLEGLGVDGTVDASARAAYGANGQWLLDPKNITIGTVTDSFSEFERIVESDEGFSYLIDQYDGANFGRSVDIWGDTLVVGSSAGKVYVFEDGAIQARLEVGGSVSFGEQVATSNGRIGVLDRDRADPSAPNNVGAFYVFTEGAGWNNGTANLSTVFYNPLSNSPTFGHAIASGGGRFYVGHPRYRIGTTPIGAVHVLNPQGGLEFTRLPPNGETFSGFGSHVAADTFSFYVGWDGRTVNNNRFYYEDFLTGQKTVRDMTLTIPYSPRAEANGLTNTFAADQGSLVVRAVGAVRYFEFQFGGSFTESLIATPGFENKSIDFSDGTVIVAQENISTFATQVGFYDAVTGALETTRNTGFERDVSVGIYGNNAAIGFFGGIGGVNWLTSNFGPRDWSGGVSSQVLEASIPWTSFEFGKDVAVDGSTIAISDPQTSSFRRGPQIGSVYVYENDSLAAVVEGGFNNTFNFGSRLDLSGDTLAVLSPFGSDLTPRAYIFERGTGWRNGTSSRTGFISDGDFSGSLEDIAISGNTFAAVAHDNNGLSNLLVWENTTGNWQTTFDAGPTNTIETRPTGSRDEDSRIQMDGNTIGVYSPQNTYSWSSPEQLDPILVFENIADDWSQAPVRTELFPGDISDVSVGSVFDISGDTIVAGPQEGSDTSGIYVFERTSDWASSTTPVARLSLSPIGTWGTRVAVHDDTVAMYTQRSGGNYHFFERQSGWQDGDANLVASFDVPDVRNRVYEIDLSADRLVIPLDSFASAGFNRQAMFLKGPFDYTGLNTFSMRPGDSVGIAASALTQSLSLGTDITLQANNDITINEAILTDNPDGDGGALSLNAGRNILVNASIDTDNGDLTLIANDSRAIQEYRDAGDSAVVIGRDALNQSVKLTLGTGDLLISAGDAFENRSGSASPFIFDTTSPGSFLVYANSPDHTGALDAGNLLADLSTTGRDFVQYNTSFNLSDPRPSALPAGSGFVYAVQPSLLLSVGNDTITYGETPSPSLTLDSATLGGSAINLATFGINSGSLGDLVDFGLASSVPTSAGGFANAGSYTGGLVAAAKTDTSSGGVFGLDLVTAGAGDLTVNKATLNARPDDFIKTYGDANPGFTIDYTGFVTGDSSNDLDTPMTVATTAVERSNVGGYTLTANGGFDNNYRFNPTGTGLLTINARDVLISGLTGLDRVYDATTNAQFAGNATINALSGDAVSLAGGLTATAAFADKNVGNNKTMTFSGFSLSGTSAQNYNLVLPTTVTADVTPATLQIAGLTADDKTYDRTTDATLQGTAAVTGLASDAVSLTGTAVGNFADKNAAADKAVAVSGVSLTGTDALNYVLAVSSGLFADIFQLDLDLTGLTANSRIYDATTDATLSGTAQISPISGDSVNLAGSAVGNFADKNVGTSKAVAVSGVSLSGGDAQNYNLVLPTNLTADVTPATLAITGVTAESRVYDATIDAGLTDTAIVTALGADEVTIDTIGSGTFADKNVGSDKAVTVTGFTLAGADATNYLVQQPSGLTADITPRPITITGLTTDDKIYDATTSATASGTATFGGILAGDVATINVSGFSFAFADKNVGTDKPLSLSGVSVTGVGSGNYTAAFAQDFVASITPATLAVLGVSAVDRIYNADTAVNLTGGSLDGILLADVVAIDTSAATGALADKRAGADRAVTAQGFAATGIDADNYVVAQPTGLTATIDRAPLQIVGLSGDKTYDQTVNAPLTNNGLDAVFALDDVSIDESAVSATYADKNAGTNKPITIAGLFGLSGLDALNYDLSQPIGLLGEIARRGITVSGLTIADKTYDGTNIGEISGTGTFGGAIDGDDLAVDVGNIDVTFADKNAGENKAIALSGVTLSGADADNYTAATPAGITATIFKKDLTVDGLATEDKVYDRTDVATITGSGSLQGIVGIESVLLDESNRTGAFDDKNVGTSKTVVVNGLSLSNPDAVNYNLVAPSFLANITPASVGISGLSGVDRTYDSTTTAGIAGIGNLEFGLLAGVLAALEDVSLAGNLSGLFANKNAELNKPMTLVGASLAGADATNYTLVLPSDLAADVTPADLVITGTQISDKVYDGTDVATIASSGSVSALSGDTVLLGGSLAATFDNKNVGQDKPVAIAGYTLTGTDAANYNLITPSTLSASISQAVLTLFGVTADDKTYDGSNVAPLSGTLQIAPFGADDVTIAGAPTATFADKNVAANREVMIAGLSLSGVDASNYSFVLPSLFADIIPRVLSVSGISALSRIYDGTTDAELTGTAVLANTIAGDDIGFDLGSIAGQFSDKHVATGKAVALTGNGLIGTESDNYTQALPFNLVADVTPKRIDILGVDAVDRAYDATVDVELVGGSLNGVVTNDVVSLRTTNAEGTVATKNVGEDKDVTATGYSLTGADANNYALTQPDYVDVTITRRILDILGIQIADKFFDDTTDATLSGGTLAGFIPGDSVSLITSQANAEFLDSDVATDKPVAISGFELSGADAANYQIDPELEATGTILPLLEEIADVVPAEVLRANASEARAAQRAELEEFATLAADAVNPVDYESATAGITAGLPAPKINPAIRKLDASDPNVASYIAAADRAQAAFTSYTAQAANLRSATRQFKQLGQDLKSAKSEAVIAAAMTVTLENQITELDAAIATIEENLALVQVAKESIAGLKQKIAEASRLGRGAEVAQYENMLAESEAVLAKEAELKSELARMQAERSASVARLAENQSNIERAETLQAQYDDAEASIQRQKTSTASAKAGANAALAALEDARAEGEATAKRNLENVEANIEGLRAEMVDPTEEVQKKYEGMTVAEFRTQTNIELSSEQLARLDATSRSFGSATERWNALKAKENQQTAQLEQLKRADDVLFANALALETTVDRMQMSSDDIAAMDMKTLNIPDEDLLRSTSTPIRNVAASTDSLIDAIDALGPINDPIFRVEGGVKIDLSSQLDGSSMYNRGLADIDQPIVFDEVTEVVLKSELQRYNVLPVFKNEALASLSVTQQLQLQGAMQAMADKKQALIDQGMDPNQAAQEAMDDKTMEIVTMALFEKFDKYGIGDIPGVQAFAGAALGELAVQYGVDPGGMASNLANGDFGAFLGNADDAVNGMADQYVKLMTNPAEFGVDTFTGVGKALGAGVEGAVNAFTGGGGGGGETDAARQQRLVEVRQNQLRELSGALVGLEENRLAAVAARDAQLETVRTILVAETIKDETQDKLAFADDSERVERDRVNAVNQLTQELYMEAAIERETTWAEANNESKAQQIAVYENSLNYERSKLAAFSASGAGQ